jgi:RNA polymerase sigma-70 factor (ECF subfamily)
VPSSTHSETAADVRAWIEAAHNGSREALGRLLEQFRPYLLRLANSELDAQLQAKGSGSDLVQETFLEVQRIFGRFQGSTTADLLAWLHTILLNKVATFTRQYRATAKRRIAREVALDVAGASDAQDACGLEAREPTPSHRVIHDEQAESLHRALERLPADYRQVIHWRQWEELSYEEIARRLNRSVDAARMLWWRAIERLQRELQPSA